MKEAARGIIRIACITRRAIPWILLRDAALELNWSWNTKITWLDFSDSWLQRKRLRTVWNLNLIHGESFPSNAVLSV